MYSYQKLTTAEYFGSPMPEFTLTKITRPLSFGVMSAYTGRMIAWLREV